MINKALIKTIDNVYQPYQLRSAIDALSLHSCPIEPLSAVYNGKEWSASGRVINYKGQACVRYGSKLDLLDVHHNIYKNKRWGNHTCIGLRKEMVNSFRSMIKTYDHELRDLMNIDGVCNIESKLILKQILNIKCERPAFRECDDLDEVVLHCYNIYSCILQGERCIYLGNFNRTLSHVAIQKIANRVLYNNNVECALALYIANDF